MSISDLLYDAASIRSALRRCQYPTYFTMLSVSRATLRHCQYPTYFTTLSVSDLLSVTVSIQTIWRRMAHLEGGGRRLLETICQGGPGDGLGFQAGIRNENLGNRGQKSRRYAHPVCIPSHYATRSQLVSPCQFLTGPHILPI
jgi:hypothetical protein